MNLPTTSAVLWRQSHASRSTNDSATLSGNDGLSRRASVDQASTEARIDAEAREFEDCLQALDSQDAVDERAEAVLPGDQVFPGVQQAVPNGQSTSSFAGSALNDVMIEPSAAEHEQGRSLAAAEHDRYEEIRQGWDGSAVQLGMQTGELPNLSGSVEAPAGTAPSPTWSWNEAAARIVEEMQLRSRRAQAGRWQISLPGPGATALQIRVELLEDHGWRVQLIADEQCDEQDRLSLQERLSVHWQDVDVTFLRS